MPDGPMAMSWGAIRVHLKCVVADAWDGPDCLVSRTAFWLFWAIFLFGHFVEWIT
jgi:hypothetical protein